MRLGEGVQVADRRPWQSAKTSPIGDPGSERVIKIGMCNIVSVLDYIAQHYIY